MSQIVEVRELQIGTGIPKICVPIVEETADQILTAARGLEGLADVVEWRVDWFESAPDFRKIEEVLRQLRLVLGDMPLLFTFRTRREGGEKELESGQYVSLNQQAAASGLVDLVDAELFTADERMEDLIAVAHANGVKVVASSHDFAKTPVEEEMVGRLLRMQDLDADLPKIAVMPQCKKDVLTLLETTREMSEAYANRPIITMSMGELGLLSRLCGEIFGSALTFGTAGKASAPGQIDAVDLRRILTLIHDYL